MCQKTSKNTINIFFLKYYLSQKYAKNHGMKYDIFELTSRAFRIKYFDRLEQRTISVAKRSTPSHHASDLEDYSSLIILELYKHLL